MHRRGPTRAQIARTVGATRLPDRPSAPGSIQTGISPLDDVVTGARLEGIAVWRYTNSRGRADDHETRMTINDPRWACAQAIADDGK